LSLASKFIIVFVGKAAFPVSFFAANAKPRKLLATISDEAMAMAKRAAIVLLVNITIDVNARFLRNMKINKVHYIFKTFTDVASVK
jgi:hypothetical protein